MVPAGTDALGSQALRAKNARIRAEQDRQLLQNRINRLIIEEEKAATVAALATAETERDRAIEAETEAAKQRDEAAQRAEELQQVSDFQAEQLSGIDVPAMGASLKTKMIEELELKVGDPVYCLVKTHSIRIGPEVQ